MRGQGHGLGGVSALLALAALAGCATPQEAPLVEIGGAPVAGLSDGAYSASAPSEPHGLIAVSGNAMLLGPARSDVAAVPAPLNPTAATPLAASAVSDAATDLLDTDGTAGPVLALNAQPAALPGVLAGNSRSPLMGGAQGVLTPAAQPMSTLSPVTVGVQSVLTPATATNPGAATTQLANALVSTVSRAGGGGGGGGGGVTPPTMSPMTPGGTSIGRLVSGLTNSLGN